MTTQRDYHDEVFQDQLARFAHQCITNAKTDDTLTKLARQLEAERRRLEEERANMLDAEGIMMKSLERALRDDERELLSDVQ